MQTYQNYTGIEISEAITITGFKEKLVEELSRQFCMFLLQNQLEVLKDQFLKKVLLKEQNLSALLHKIIDSNNS